MIRTLLCRIRGCQKRSHADGDEVDGEPFPVQQMVVLSLCRICEPIAFMSIFPYIYYMIQSFSIASNERQIAVYAGMVTSAFAFAEFSSAFIWGRLSDRLGRKPVLLTGLAGTGLSMIVFGFASNLQTALLARALGGLLNGNIGVIQTTVAEVVKNKRHQPRAYSIMPFVWCLGSIVGAGLGGCLADPVKNYPTVFNRNTIWAQYPYLLPNIICSLVVVLGLLVGVLFLEETHAEKKQRRDAGLELGYWLTRRLLGRPADAERYSYSRMAEKTSLGEASALMADESFTATTSDVSFSAQSTPKLGPTAATERELPQSLDLAASEHELSSENPRLGALAAFNSQVCLNILAYGLLAFHTITFEQLMPVMLSMDPSDHPVTLPFKFIGGFGLPSSTIGLIFSLQGVYQMVAQIGLFPLVHNRLGSLRTFRICALLYPLLYMAVPYLVLLPNSLRMLGLVVVLVWKVSFQALAYPSNMLLLTNSTPSPLVLGAVNGVAASSASLARAFGPTLSGLFESYGLRLGYLGLPWWIGGAVAVLGGVESLFMREPEGQIQDRQLDERQVGCRSARASTDTEAGQSTMSDDTLVGEGEREQLDCTK